MTMITFDAGSRRFNFRVAGVLIEEGHVLLQRGAREDYWILPGGRAELGESSEETVERELREELGVATRAERLLWIAENFFDLAGKEYHELLLVWLASLPEACDFHDRARTFEGTDGGVRFVLRWWPLAGLMDVPLCPAFLRSRLASLPETTEHIVQDERPQRPSFDSGPSGPRSGRTDQVDR